MAEVILNSVTRDGDRVYANFADGNSLEFQNLENLKTHIDQLVDQHQVMIMCLAWALARSADLSNINTVKDKKFVVDFSVANPVQVK
jgi:hypothetical protein